MAQAVRLWPNGTFDAVGEPRLTDPEVLRYRTGEVDKAWDSYFEARLAFAARNCVEVGIIILIPFIILHKNLPWYMNPRVPNRMSYSIYCCLCPNISPGLLWWNQSGCSSAARCRAASLSNDHQLYLGMVWIELIVDSRRSRVILKWHAVHKDVGKALDGGRDDATASRGTGH